MMSSTKLRASTSKLPLESHLLDAKHCGQCSGQNHKTAQCRFLGQSKCSVCGRFGHKTEDCYGRKAKETKEIRHKRNFKEDRGDKKGKRFGKKPRKEETNKGEEVNDEEHIVLTLSERACKTLEKAFDSLEEDQFFNFDNPDVNNPTAMDE